MVTKEMKLTDAYAKSVTANAGKQNKSGDESFKAVMGAAEKSGETRPQDNGRNSAKTNEVNQSQTKPPPKKTEQTPQAEQQPRDDTKTAEKSDAGKTAQNTGDERAANVQDAKGEKSGKAQDAPTAKALPKRLKALSDAEKDALQSVADLLGKDVGEIADILAAMNVSVLELSKPEVLAEFTQKLLGAESPAVLLTLPNAAETVKPLQTLAETFKPQAAEFKEEIDGINEQFKALLDAVRAAQNVDPNAVQDDASLGQTQTVFKEAVAQTSQMPSLRQQAAQKFADLKMEITDVKVEIKPAFGASALNGEEVARVEEALGDESGQQQQFSGDESGQNPSAAQTQQVAQKPAETDFRTRNDEGNAAVNAVNANPSARAAEVITRAQLQTPTARVDQASIIAQLADKIKVDVRADITTEIRMTLKPEHLGDVTMKIVTQNGIVTAQFTAESQRVKEIIESGFADLRERLKEQGVNINQLSVSVGQDSEAEERMSRYQAETARSSARIARIRNIGATEDVAEETPVADTSGGSIIDFTV